MFSNTPTNAARGRVGRRGLTPRASQGCSQSSCDLRRGARLSRQFQNRLSGCAGATGGVTGTAGQRQGTTGGPSRGGRRWTRHGQDCPTGTGGMLRRGGIPSRLPEPPVPGRGQRGRGAANGAAGFLPVTTAAAAAAAAAGATKTSAVTAMVGGTNNNQLKRQWKKWWPWQRQWWWQRR